MGVLKSVRNFFFPKNFSGEITKGKLTTDYYMTIGAQSLKERNMMWFRFASVMPVFGMMIFYKEGKRVEAQRQINKKKK